MFAKKQDVATRTDTMLKGKDLKTFRAQLCAVLGVGDDALAVAVPPKVCVDGVLFSLLFTAMLFASQANCRRLKLASKNSVICVEVDGSDVPLPLAFFSDRVDSEATLFPSGLSRVYRLRTLFAPTDFV